ncbi:MAG: hypothetical protein HQK91_01940 [Nitrospirae bacterium]|nr:hypothetical protein [Nitrospirota bacterium]
MKQTNKTILYLIFLSLVCWGRLLFLEGLWSEDWVWLSLYYKTDTINQFLYQFLSFGHTLEGLIDYFFFSMFEYLKEDTTWVWNIIKFFFITLNGILLYLIFKNLLRYKTILPEIIGVIYMVSPVVHVLWVLQIARTIFMSFFLLSVLFTVITLNKKRFYWSYYLGSIISMTLAMLGSETFFFFEILRPVIIYYIFSTTNGLNYYNKLKSTLLHWSPYILICIIIMLYTLTAPVFGSNANTYRPQYLSILDIFNQVFFAYVNSIYVIFIAVYKQLIGLSLVQGDTLTYLFSFFAMFITIIRLLNIKEKGEVQEEELREVKVVMIFGLLLIIAGIFPYAAIRGTIRTFNGSRHALQASVGVAVLVPSTLLYLYYKNIITKNLFKVFFIIIVLLDVCACNAITVEYALMWQKQQSFWWQFVWRVPDLKKDASIILDVDCKASVINQEVGGVSHNTLNILYANSRGERGFGTHYVGYNQYQDIKDYIEKDASRIPIYTDTLLESLSYNTNNMIVASFRDGVLSLNGDIDYTETIKCVNNNPIVKKSNSNCIVINQNKKSFPFRSIIGHEPVIIHTYSPLMNRIRGKLLPSNDLKKDWIYYYQNAKLLSARKDFSSIVKLYDETKSPNQYMNEDLTKLPAEILVPFIQALYIKKDYTRGSSLLWQWAMYYNGSLKKALEIRDNILMIGENIDAAKILDKDIKEVW